MVESKLLDNFRIRTPEEGNVKFTKSIHKWQILYLDQKNDTQIHFDVKGRQVGLSSLYKFLAMYYFLIESKPLNITYFVPSMDMHEPRIMQMNAIEMDIPLVSNQRYMLEHTDGSRIRLKSLYNDDSLHSIGKEDIIFVDEFFHINVPKRRNFEKLVDSTVRNPVRKLFVGGSLSVDFEEDAKLIRHVNNLPTPITKNFIINDRTSLELSKLMMLGTERAIYEYRPDTLFDLLEDEYSDNFKMLG